MTCSVATCGQPAVVRGMCNRDCMRWWRGRFASPYVTWRRHWDAFQANPAQYDLVALESGGAETTRP